MSHEELFNTAFDVRLSIEYRLKNHWVNHQSNWTSNEKERLARCKNMFVSLGRPDLYDCIFDKAKEIFNDFNESKK